MRINGELREPSLQSRRSIHVWIILPNRSFSLSRFVDNANNNNSSSLVLNPQLNFDVLKGAPDLMDIVQNARCQGSDYSFGKVVQTSACQREAHGVCHLLQQMCDEIKARYEDNQMSMKVCTLPFVTYSTPVCLQPSA